jgi:hypothetical protein
MSREISDTTWREPIPPFSSPAAGAHLRCAVLADLPEAGRHAAGALYPASLTRCRS